MSDYYLLNPLLLGLKTSEVDKLYQLMFRMNLASVILSFFTTLTYYLNHESRKRGTSNLSVYFGIASGGFNLSLLLAEFVGRENFLDGEGWCIAQAFMVEFFLNSIIMWWFSMTFHMWASIVQGKLEIKESGTKYYHIVAWGSSLIISLILLLTDQLGNSGFWCWIKGKKFELQMGVFFLQMCFYLVVGAVMWVSTIYKVFQIMKSKSRGFDEDQKRGFYFRVARQVVFIICFCVVFCISFSNRVKMDKQSGIEGLYDLWELHVVTAGIIGILYFLVFTSTDSILYWVYRIKAYLCIKRKQSMTSMPISSHTRDSGF